VARRWAAITVLALSGVSEASAEAPGVWFLNARRTGPDFVYLSVGGTRSAPPAARDDVRLGWSWSGDSDDTLYPNRTLTRYVRSEHPEKQAKTWTLEGGAGFPPLALGPGGELLLIATERSEAPGWAEVLDGVEAAYRQSVFAPEERFATLEIGKFGECIVRSRPLDPGETVSGWGPFDLEAHARPSRAGGFHHVDPADAPAAAEVKPLRIVRFLRWLEGPCSEATGRRTLRLFPVPPAEKKLGSDFFFTTDAGVVDSGFFDLAPDDWTAAGRSRTRPRPTVLAVEAFLTSDQRSAALSGEPVDLCRARGMEAACAADRRLRRQLYTWNSSGSQGTAVGERLGQACEAALVPFLGEETSNLCSGTDGWQRNLGGIYRTGYVGDLVLHEAPGIVSRWDADGQVKWIAQTDAGMDISFSLPDTTRVRLRVFFEPDDASSSLENGETGAAAMPDLSARLWGPWLLYLAVPLLLGVLVLLLWRPRRPRIVVSEQLAAGPLGEAEPAAKRPSSFEHELRASLEAQSRQLDSLRQEVTRSEEALHEELRELRARMRSMGEQLQAQQGQLETHREQLRRLEVPSVAGSSNPWFDFREELEGLDEAERRRIAGTIAAMGDLGQWIHVLLPLLEGMDRDPEAPALSRDLPPPARKEWERSFDILRAFARRDATVYRGLRRNGQDPGSGVDREPAAAAEMLDRAGLLDRSRPLGERLRHHLAPPDARGRLGEVTLALQYVLEAFPIEHLEGESPNALRRDLEDRLRTTGLPADFHQLVQDAASGLGLRYQAVRYYRVRVGQEGFPFLDREHSTISLSKRVGYSAATDPGIVVRLSELFLFEEMTGKRISGHAQIAESASNSVGATTHPKSG
jgi:hypothetical protein